MGAVLSRPVSSQLLQRHGNKNYKVGSSEMQGYRMSMEDTHVVACSLNDTFPDVGLFGVFDGHAGEKASLFLEHELHKRVSSLEDPTSHDQLRDCTVKLDADFCSIEGDRDHGSTCCYTVVQPNAERGGWDITAVNVGDSRAIIVKSDGSVVALTEDHKPENPQEAARIVAAGGEVRVNRVDGQLAMSRAIGDWQYKDNRELARLEQKVIPLPEITTTNAQPGDVLLVCCDGIVEQMSNEDAGECVRREMEKFNGYGEVDPAVVCQELLKYSITRGSKDNHSALIILFDDGSTYRREKHEFIAGPFHPYESDKNFVKAYLTDAAKHGYQGDELMELARQTEASMPELQREEANRSAEAGPGPGIEVLQRFLSQPGDITERLSVLSALFGARGDEGDE